MCSYTHTDLRLPGVDSVSLFLISVKDYWTTLTPSAIESSRRLSCKLRCWDRVIVGKNHMRGFSMESRAARPSTDVGSLRRPCNGGRANAQTALQFAMQLHSIESR